jgi:hypothetical protein
MLSNYPRRVPTFPSHQNLIENVDASHINVIQNELTGVMEVLGPNPHIYNDINVPAVDTQAAPTDDGGVIDDETVFNPGVYRYYDPRISPVDHGNVGQRLDDIERGKQNHVFRLGAANLNLTSSSTSLSTLPRAIRMSKPADSIDPFNYFNSWGVTLRKSGFWVFHGFIGWTLLGADAAANNGVYQVGISYDNNWTEGMARLQSPGTDRSPAQNVHLEGFFNRGTRVLLRVAQDSGRSQRIRMARLTGHLVREVV